jgi:ERCC4-type nuclease
VDQAEVALCRRRGAAIDLVLNRPKLARSQFVFTTVRGRPAIWWQTLQTARFANPGARVPRGRAADSLTIALDTREKYGWRFAGREVRLEHRALPAGDYAAIADGEVVAVVERKTLADLATSLSNGSLAFQMQRLAEIRRAAVVVEGEYPHLFGTQPGRGSWLADMLGRLAARYPDVPVIFASSRKFAEEWTFRFLGAAVEDSNSVETQRAEVVDESASSISQREAGASARGSLRRSSPGS